MTIPNPTRDIAALVLTAVFGSILFLFLLLFQSDKNSNAALTPPWP